MPADATEVALPLVAARVPAAFFPRLLEAAAARGAEDTEEEEER